MWKGKSYLDRNYSAITPRSTNDLRYEIYGEVDPIAGDFSEFPELEDDIEDSDPKHVFLLVFCIACFIFAASLLVAYVAISMSRKSADA